MWKGRVEAAENGETLGYKDALEYSKGRLDRALERQQKHVEKGTARLFRSRKRWERDPSRGTACVWPTRVRIEDGAVRFPGGRRNGLLDNSMFHLAKQVATTPR